MKKTVVSLIMALGLIGVIRSGKADTTVPLCIRTPETFDWVKTADAGRSVNGLIVQLLSLTGDGESKAQLIATQEGNNINACGGTAVCEEAQKENELKKKLGAAEDSEFEGSAVAYVLAKVLKQDSIVGYAPLKKALNASKNATSVRGGVKSAVEKTFFVRAEKPTAADLDTARKHRQEYIQEAATRHVSLAYNVKNHIVNDLEIISEAPIIGDGELGALAIDSYTLEQAIYMELVDLTLQIEMMEADAVQFMAHQPLILMGRTKPTSTEEVPAAEGATS